MPSVLGIQYSSSGLSLKGSVKEGHPQKDYSHPSNKHYTILGHTTTLCLHHQILGLSMYMERDSVCLSAPSDTRSVYVYGER